MSLLSIFHFENSQVKVGPEKSAIRFPKCFTRQSQWHQIDWFVTENFACFNIWTTECAQQARLEHEKFQKCREHVGSVPISSKMWCLRNAQFTVRRLRTQQLNRTANVEQELLKLRVIEKRISLTTAIINRFICVTNHVDKLVKTSNSVSS